MSSPDPIQPYRRVQASTDAQLKRVLEQAAKDIRQRILRLPRGVGGDVRGAQLRVTLAAIKKVQRSMWRGAIGPAVSSGIDGAEKAAESAIETMTRVAYASLSERVADALVDGLRAAAQSGLKSDAARRKRELSTRVYHQEAFHEGKLEELIRRGLVSNLTAKELATDAYKYVSPTTPGGASYAAMRLARTEINNAFHERQVEGAKRPGVKAARWNLSGSHKVPDECNLFAVQNLHGDGPGLYPAGQIPDKPHPQCFCFLTYESMSPKAFSEALASGDFHAEIDRRTKANLARLGQPVGQSLREPVKKSPMSTEQHTRIMQTISDADRQENALLSTPTGINGEENRGFQDEQERESAEWYVAEGYSFVNSFLRGSSIGTERSKETIKLLDAVMDRSKLTKDIGAYRGMDNGRLLFGDSLDADLTGLEWREKGYSSITVNEDVAGDFTDTDDEGQDTIPVKMRIALPKGTSTFQASDVDDEAELIIARNSAFRVIRDHGEDDSGIRVLDVELVLTDV